MRFTQIPKVVLANDKLHDAGWSQSLSLANAVASTVATLEEGSATDGHGGHVG
jgi:hypothetical protein